MHNPAKIAALLPVILCGGEGRRLAPLSTPQRPKPFLPFGEGKTLFQQAALRANTLSDSHKPLIVCIQKSYPTATAPRDTRITSRTRTRIGLVYITNVFTETSNDLTRTVRRSIIDNDHLTRPIALSKHTLDSTPHMLPGIVSRDNNAN